jgi:glucosylceramidase
VYKRQDEIYFTPLYYTLAQFSRFIRPGSVRIGLSFSDPDVLATAVENPDGSFAVLLFNPSSQAKGISLSLADQTMEFSISAKAIQTVILPALITK